MSLGPIKSTSVKIKVSIILNLEIHFSTPTINIEKIKQTFTKIKTGPEIQEKAIKNYKKVTNDGAEYLVSCSDDKTLYLWKLGSTDKPVQLVGHKDVVIDVKFSPDSRLIASASFDMSIRLWNGRTGKCITKFLGHVQRAFMLSWAADSRLIASCSADTTIKCKFIDNEA